MRNALLCLSLTWVLLGSEAWAGSAATVMAARFGGRSVRVLAEAPDAQQVSVYQDDGWLRIEANRHRIAIAADGRVYVDGAARAAPRSGAIEVVVRGDGVELRPAE